MVRKITGMFIAVALFFGLALNAAASPITSAPVNNMYTQNNGATANVEPDIFPGVVAAVAVGAKAAAAGAKAVAGTQFVQGVAAGVAANFVYDGIRGGIFSDDQTLDTPAEVIFDY